MKLTNSRSYNFRLSPEKIEVYAGLFVIGLGLFFRFRQYTLNLSLWLDEAMLALNIVSRSFGDLARPLDYDQGAPLGFLWLTKFAQIILGNNEYSLRLFPFIAACAALFVLWLLVRRVTGPVGGIFALLVLASSRHIISYGAQVKQYAVDVVISLLIYLLGVHLLRKTITNKEYWLLVGFGAIAIWISHAAVFSLAGMGMVLIVSMLLKRNWSGALRCGLASVFWMINFGFLYLIQYRSLGENNFLINFWKDYFLPLDGSAFAWTLERLGGLLYNPGGMWVKVPLVMILVLFFAGLFSFFARREGWGWMFALTLILTLAASALEKYPFGGRMGMFALPGLLICIGEGLELVRRLFHSRLAAGLVISLLIGGFLIYTPLAYSIEQAIKPKVVENIAPTMAFLSSNYRQGDGIYLYRGSIPAFRYYAPKYGLEKAPVMDGADFHLDRTGYLAEMEQLAGKKRVWLLFSHLTDPEYVQDRDAILEYAGQLGDKKREFSDPGTAINLYMFDFVR